eukprot:g2313.t1
MVIAKTMALLVACVALLLGGWSASCAATPYAHQFPVHRLLQYDLDDSQMGSRKSVMDLMVVTPPLIEKAAAKGTSKKVVPLKRRAAMVRMSDTTKDELSSLVTERKIGALLIVLPTDEESLAAKNNKAWQDLEGWLLSTKIECPVYFAQANAYTTDMYETISSIDASGRVPASDYYLKTMSATDARIIKSPTLQNIHGILFGGADDESNEDEDEDAVVPSIALVAHYDSFGATESLASDSGSGATALLQLARLFSSLRDNNEEDVKRGGYDVVFVLTSGGNLNFAGARDWLSAVDPQILETIEFALCIENDIDTSSHLTLHTSKAPTDPTIEKLHDALTAASKITGTTFELKRKRINIDDPILAWEHEQFAIKRIVGGTLSSKTEAPAFLSRGSIFHDSGKSLGKNIQFIAEAVARLAYPALSDFDGKLFDGKVDTEHVSKWSTFFSSTPRIVTQGVAAELEKELKDSLSETQTLPFTLSKDDLQPVSLYSSDQDGSGLVMKAYVKRDIFSDLKLFVAVGLYLSFLANLRSSYEFWVNN